MESVSRRLYLYGSALALVCSASAFAQPTVSFTVQSPTGPAFANYVYVSPYSAQIAGSTSVVPAICDDWADENYLGQNWTAFDTNLGTSSLSNVYYSGGYNSKGASVSQVVAYDAAAILAENLLALPGGPWTPANTLAQDAYSFAIWELFDSNSSGGPAAYLQSLGNSNTGVGGTAPTASAVASLAATYLDSAIATAQGSSVQQSWYSNVQIFSSACTTGSGTATCAAGSGRPQEFLVVSMSEAPSPVLLGLYLVGLGGIAIYYRRRTAQSL